MVSSALGKTVVHCPHFEEAASLAPKKPAARRAKKTSKEDREQESRKEGCLWTGPHRDLERHLKSDCAHALRECNLCNKVMAKSMIEHHVEEECLERSMPCAFCNNDFIVSELKDHEDVCNKSPHVAVSCVCRVKLARGQIDDHIKNDMAGHLLYLMTLNQSLVEQNEALEARVTQLEKNAVQDLQPFAEFEQSISLDAKWFGPDMPFGGIDFCLQFDRGKTSLVLVSRKSAGTTGLREIRVSCFVNGQLLASPTLYQSDGKAFLQGMWRNEGVAQRDFVMPVPINGVFYLKVRIVREK